MKRISHIVCSACLACVFGVTALALVTNRFGWALYLEIFSHFQVQYFSLVLLFTGVACLLRHFRVLLAALFCSAILFAQLLPWYIPSNIGLPTNYRTLVANLNFGNDDAVQTLSLINVEQPDLALFIEVSQAIKTQLEVLQTTLPYSTTIASDSGIVLYSKYPLTNVHLQQFGLYARQSLVVRLEIDGQPLSVIAVHPFPPIGQKMFESRNTLLADLGTYIQNQTVPVILLGDLNTTMWSPYYQAFIQQTNLKNARKGFGIYPTWPVTSYFNVSEFVQMLIKPLQIPIDHCLVSSQIKVTNMHTGAETGSDHLPVITELWLPPSANS